MTEISEKQNEVLQALAVIGPMTNYELQLHLDWPIQSVQNIVQKLKRKELARIVSYELNRTGHYVPLYAEGGGADCRKPAKVTKKPDLPKLRKELGVWAGLGG